jgi:hypothetical protein
MEFSAYKPVPKTIAQSIAKERADENKKGG